MRPPPAVSRAMRELGENLRNGRKLQGLTAEQLAERAAISRNTLRALETEGTGSSETLLKVLRVLGMLGATIAATDPYGTDVGRLRMDEQLPERVRPPRWD